jgi:hypothetical protein
MNFLPDNYELPKASGDYLKLEDGENRLRVLSFPILGWEDWNDKTPVRYRYENKPSMSIDPKKPFKHFWAMIVWNCLLSKVQIWNVTQGTIKHALDALSKDADWGAPFHYDIKVFKSGEKMETKYVITPVSHKPLTQEVLDAFAKKPCYLDALFSNADPFAAGDKCTPMAIHASTPVSSPISAPASFQNRIDSGYQPIPTSEHVQNARTLEAMIHPDDADYKARILDWFKVTTFEQIPAAELMKLAPEIQQKFAEKMKEEHARKVG